MSVTGAPLGGALLVVLAASGGGVSPGCLLLTSLAASTGGESVAGGFTPLAASTGSVLFTLLTGSAGGVLLGVGTGGAVLWSPPDPAIAAGSLPAGEFSADSIGGNIGLEPFCRKGSVGGVFLEFAPAATAEFDALALG